MKLPRDFSGELLAQALCRAFGYVRVHQVGSHMLRAIQMIPTM